MAGNQRSLAPVLGESTHSVTELTPLEILGFTERTATSTQFVEALKVYIVDKTLPDILRSRALKSLGGDATRRLAKQFYDEHKSEYWTADLLEDIGSRLGFGRSAGNEQAVDQ